MDDTWNQFPFFCLCVLGCLPSKKVSKLRSFIPFASPLSFSVLKRKVNVNAFGCFGTESCSCVFVTIPETERVVYCVLCAKTSRFATTADCYLS
jgi:hypothetical protein